MTEAEWSLSAEPGPLVFFVQGWACQRRLRLLTCAFCRRIEHLVTDERLRAALELAERFADGQATVEELRRTAVALQELANTSWRRGLRAGDREQRELFWLQNAALAVRETVHERLSWDEESDYGPPGEQAALVAAAPGDPDWQSIREEALRFEADVVRDIFYNPLRPTPNVDGAVCAWEGGAVTQLARVAYEHRLPKGTLDPARLALVADALEDAGCTDAHLLGHLRGPGPHVRGCWAVDLILSKDR